MKCLLCKFKPNNNEQLWEHYINYHNVDKDNKYFEKLFAKENDFLVAERCHKCNEFIPTLKYRNAHNFLKHYKEGREIISEEKPINVVDIGNSIKKFEIKFSEHSEFYDFYNSEKLVDEFLTNVRRKIKRSNEYFLVKGGFSIEHFQATLDNYNEPLKNTRYWSTEPIETKSFNDFVYFNIRESILKRVIKNGMTGSSWRFNRFIYINLKTFSLNESMLKL